MADALEALLTEAVRRLRSARATSALPVHHDDADGLASGALLSLALEAEGCAVERLPVAATIPGDAAEGFAHALARAAGGG